MAGNPIIDKELSTGQNIFAAWPLILVLVGGLLGGICGGVAWQVNVQIFKKMGNELAAYLTALVSGLFAFAAYFGIVLLLVMKFPSLAQ